MIIRNAHCYILMNFCVVSFTLWQKITKGGNQWGRVQILSLFLLIGYLILSKFLKLLRFLMHVICFIFHSRALNEKSMQLLHTKDIMCAKCSSSKIIKVFQILFSVFFFCQRTFFFVCLFAFSFISSFVSYTYYERYSSYCMSGYVSCTGNKSISKITPISVLM